MRLDIDFQKLLFTYFFNYQTISYTKVSNFRKFHKGHIYNKKWVNRQLKSVNELNGTEL